MLDSGKVTSEISHFYTGESLTNIRADCDHKFDRKSGKNTSGEIV